MVQDKCATPNATRLRLHQSQNHLNRNGRIDGRATSLQQELPATIREVNRELLAVTLLRELAAVLPLWGEDFHEVVAAVRKRSLLIGHGIRAKVNGHDVHGRVLDLNHEGHLILEQADGSSMVLSSAAEVRVQ